ncbi:DUF397 domain-containing protein [Actinomycetospora sp. NBRC 106375]|uniref:DUF397 domain-containing protein n=1 Tax=Actinomycetospora sp. NBRC 106375 TaxID=3032207 RepID=UPI0025545E09|nr:DUF397 domain-containing protein [Actinomycetospora sp. NBRC 106375]
MTDSAPRFLRSSFCGPGNCVEVAFSEDRVLVRDSKNPDGGQLSFTHTDWMVLVDWVKERADF